MKIACWIRFRKLYTSHMVSIFFASLDLNLSYSWRGIWEAQKALLKGRIWIIGDRLFVKTWQDPWIPRMAVLTCIMLHNGGIDSDLIVSYLLDTISNT